MSTKPYEPYKYWDPFIEREDPPEQDEEEG